ncbi:MAG TPA: hypothetical protein VLE97_08840 [Gaiellaceae bacterium]|nr:hypothetical protein [Gaiellaceae bacterium]
MSLYNLLHGFSPNAAALLHALKLDPRQIDRFRDASFGKDGETHVIHIFCRTGGGNREDYPNTVLTSHPLYLRDHDDDYDPTYAHYYFTIPKEVLDELAEQKLSLDDVTVTESLQEKTEAAIEAIKSMPPPKRDRLEAAVDSKTSEDEKA